MELSTKIQEGDGDFSNVQDSTTIETGELVKSNISTHQFSTRVMDSQIFYQVTKFGTTLFVWIGGEDASMKDLVFASATPYDKGKTPASTKLLGNVGETLSTSLAVKLTQRLKKPVYVSYNLPIANDSVGLHGVISRLMEEVSVCPDKF